MNQEPIDLGEFLLNDIVNQHFVKINLEREHCKVCFATRLFALSFIHHGQYGGFDSEEFRSRADHIVDGLFLFLQQKSISAIYTILPQLEGIVKDHLVSKGLLKEQAEGYPLWTDKATLYRAGEKCRNMRQAICEGAKNPLSQIGKFMSKLKDYEKLLERILTLRNKTIHGSLTSIEGHEAVDVILLLYALYHDLEAKLTSSSPL